jgi:hypothetical protein
MFAQRLAVARPLVRQARIIPAPARSFIVGFPRKPTTAPLDPQQYPEHTDATDPGMVGTLPATPTTYS